MAAQKIFVLLALLVAVTAASSLYPNGHPEQFASANNKSHHLTVGYRAPGDRLVLRQSVQKNSSWMQVISVTKTFNASRYDRITQVNAFDQKVNGKGAYPSLLQGGPGYNNVTLKFKSQRGHGINFIVELYARP
ncbi:probable salivary secreted peptide [Prorops nasuta]|uniref:probable salivary secreted peptide n=1 Tax=Prorops nasuta TaxID=863751 RepID=UPI0034CE76E5